MVLHFIIAVVVGLAFGCFLYFAGSLILKDYRSEKEKEGVDNDK